MATDPIITGITPQALANLKALGNISKPSSLFQSSPRQQVPTTAPVQSAPLSSNNTPSQNNGYDSRGVPLGVNYSGEPSLAPGYNAVYDTKAPKISGSQQDSGNPTAPTNQNSGTTYFPRNVNSSDPAFATAQASQQPTQVPTEDQIFSNLYSILAPVLDAINQNEASAETQANIEARKAESAANAGLNARGMAGSSEATAQQATVDEARNAAIQQAKADQATKVASLVQWAIPEAQSEFQAALSENDALAKNYIATQQQKAQTTVKSLGATGVTLDSLQQTNPEKYNALLQYYGGDTATMKADWVAGASPLSLDGGKPIQAGSNLIYTFKDPATGKVFTQSVDTGTPLTADWVVTKDGDGNLHLVNKVTGQSKGLSSGAGGGQNIVAAVDATRPTPETANQIVGNTGLTNNAIFQDALTFALQGTLPSMGLGSSSQVRNARTAIQNKAAAIADAAGVDLPTVRAEYAANKSALGKILPIYNQTVVNEQNAKKNFKLLTTLAQKMDDNTFQTAIPALNTWLRTGEVKLTGNTDVNNFMSALIPTLTEYAKVVTGQTSGAGVTDAARSEMQTILNAGLNASTIQSFIDNVALPDMANRVSSYEDQISNISGILGSFLKMTNAPAGTGAQTSTNSDNTASTGDVVEYNGIQYLVGEDGSLTPQSQ